MPSSVTASLRKSREMHHSAASPTRVYTTRLTVAVWPPNSHATISKRNSPILPQLSPPTMANISAMRSIIMGKTPLLFYRGYFPRIAEKYAFDKTSAGATFLALYKNASAVYYLITAYPIGLFERPAHIFIPPAGDPSCHLTWRAASARRFFMHVPSVDKGKHGFGSRPYFGSIFCGLSSSGHISAPSKLLRT